MIAHRLTLDYTLAAGWMAPFVEGVQTGQAVARTCAGCDGVSFPPVRVCGCGSADSAWTTLSGLARIVWRTDGADGSFALVQFEGATGQSVVRLSEMDEGETEGRLVISMGDLPQLVVGPKNRNAKA